MNPVRVFNGQGELVKIIESKELVKINDQKIGKIKMDGTPLARKERPELIKECTQCGKEFKTVDVREKRCSKKCKGKRNRKVKQRDCVVCGNNFLPKSNAGKYCGKPCNFYTNKGMDS
tara:strand:+ start:1874 stop:2227 length:354 start_codon:yes stop_codon:yes gene_type:complete